MTKVRTVFDASFSSSSGVSLSDLLLVGPTVHSTLVDVLLRFRLQVQAPCGSSQSIECGKEVGISFLKTHIAEKIYLKDKEE